jgi:hypothetical protein
MFSRVWFKDTIERVVVTFAEAAIGIWILAGPGDVFAVSTLEGAGAAGVIAALAAVKAALAAGVGQKGSASLSPDIATVEVPPAPPAV